jgi:hypothetical protein
LIQKCKTFEPEIKASFHSQEKSIDVRNDAKAKALIKNRCDEAFLLSRTGSTTWINDMDIVLRAQIYATHKKTPRNAAHAYATAMTSVVFTVLFSATTPPLPPVTSDQGFKTLDRYGNSIAQLPKSSTNSTSPLSVHRTPLQNRKNSFNNPSLFGTRNTHHRFKRHRLPHATLIVNSRS